MHEYTQAEERDVTPLKKTLQADKAIHHKYHNVQRELFFINMTSSLTEECDRTNHIRCRPMSTNIKTNIRGRDACSNLQVEKPNS